MLFKKIFGMIQFSGYKSFSGLYDRYAIIGFEKQLDFAERVENLEWSVDLNAGKITFGEQETYPVQVLGSFSFESQTWLWSWANQAANIPAKLLEQAKEFRAYGDKSKIDELTKPNRELALNDVHSFGLVALGMFESDGYYVGNFGAGALLVTVKDRSLSKTFSLEEEHLRILSVYPQFISLFEIKAQKKVLQNYVTAKEYRIIENTETHLIARRGEKEIVGIFDEEGRLSQLKG